MNAPANGAAVNGHEVPGEIEPDPAELMRVSLHLLGATKLRELQAAGGINAPGLSIGQTVLAAQMEALLTVLVDLGLVPLEAYQMAVVHIAGGVIRRTETAIAATPVIQVASAVKH